ncbi:hypothetical protein [Candidatus Phytoplasma tritici]
MIDSGFDFEKNIDENFDIIKEFEQLTKMEFPILVGVFHTKDFFRPYE